MLKSILKTFFFLITSLLMVYLILVFTNGGFGRKDTSEPVLSTDNPEFLFAHRGVVDKFPENSREAIERAKELNFPGLEVDIRRSADGEFILFHDGDGKRLLGIDEQIEDLNADQIRAYGLMFHNEVSPSHVITLKQMLDEYRDSFIIYLDMKLGNFKDVDDLIRLISSYDVLNSVIFASPGFLVVLYVEYRYPEVQTAMEGFNAGNEWMLNFIPKKIQPDFLSGTAKKVTKKHMDWLRKNQLDHIKIVYGIDKANYHSMHDLGVKNMIIDYFPNQ